MRFAFTLLIILSCLTIQAQDVIYLSPFHLENTKTGSTVKSILRKHDLNKDTLLIVINQRIIQGLKSLMPEAEFLIADSTYLQMLADSSELAQIQTNSSLDVVDGVAGYIRTSTMIKEGPVYYAGQNMNTGGIGISQNMMHEKHAKYFIVLNKIEIGTNFEIHFEMYDKYFNRIYGDKFVRPSKCSGKMYFSAFSYYLSKFVQTFNEELVKKIKKADMIVYP